MLKIGITGGIGSGKTTACHLFKKYNIPVYFADSRAKWLMNHSPIIKEKLLLAFGEKVFDENQKLNKKYLGNLIFNDQSKLELINSIVHPAVAEDARLWQEEQAAQGAKYTLKEAALLFESGSYQALDKIIVVTAPTDLRIQRVIQRDGLSEAEIMARINKQMPEAEKIMKADFVLTNVYLPELEEQVAALHQKLMLSLG